MALIRELRIVRLQREVDIYIARELAAHMAERAGFDTYSTADIETAVSELCTNALRYGDAGWALLARSPQGFEGSIVDEGPGFEATKQSKGLGVGLAGARRLMDDLAIDSRPTGSRVTVKKSLSGSAASVGGNHPWELVVVNRLKTGSSVSGDVWWHSVADDDRLMVAVVDGLGSGQPAAEAAHTLVGAIAAQPMDAALESIISNSHEAGFVTRGGVAIVARIGDGALEYCGVGDVAGRLQPPGERLILQPGIIGYEIGNLVTRRLEWTPDSQLLLWTDGMEPDPERLEQMPSETSANWMERLGLECGSDRDDGLFLLVNKSGFPARAERSRAL